MKLDDERIFDILKLSELGFECGENEIWSGCTSGKDKAKVEIFYNSNNRKSHIVFTLDGALWVDAILFSAGSLPEPTWHLTYSIPIQYTKKASAVWRLCRHDLRSNAEVPLSKEEINFVSSILNDCDNFT